MGPKRKRQAAAKANYEARNICRDKNGMFLHDSVSVDSDDEEADENKWVEIHFEDDEEHIDMEVITDNIDIEHANNRLRDHLIFTSDDVVQFRAFGDSDRSRRRAQKKKRDLKLSAETTTSITSYYKKIVDDPGSDIEDNVSYYNRKMQRTVMMNWKTNLLNMRIHVPLKWKQLNQHWKQSKQIN